jgi:very-short-patch-repair endonuclease
MANNLALGIVIKVIIKVIRFWNRNVIDNIEGVLEKIYLVILGITGKKE